LVTGANSKLTTINGQMLIGQQATAGNGSTLTIADSGLVQTKTLKFGFDAGSGGYIHMGVGGILAVLNDKTGGTPFASGGLFTTGGDGGQIRYNPSGDGPRG
jgi:T5SS/PEP-CTERM-associated repeat protein